MLVGDLFDRVRIKLSDQNANVYTDVVLTVPYNELQDAINVHLIRIGSELAKNTGTITADGINHRFDLESDFDAMTIDGLRPRSPIDATQDYTHGAALVQVENDNPGLEGNPTTAKQPTAFALEAGDGTRSTDSNGLTTFAIGKPHTTTHLRFNVMPPAGHIYDYTYWSVYPDVDQGNVGSTQTPFGGRGDKVFQAALYEWGKNHLEYTTEQAAAWLAAAVADFETRLGLRKLKDRPVTPSMWEGVDAGPC